jgi:hypothetical protein
MSQRAVRNIAEAPLPVGVAAACVDIDLRARVVERTIQEPSQPSSIEEMHARTLRSDILDEELDVGTNKGQLCAPLKPRHILEEQPIGA